MDPNAFYRLDTPYDSESMKSASQKKIFVPFMKAGGTLVRVSGLMLVNKLSCP